MAIFYVDLYNGNDANDGTTWATAWKTLNAGATAARIAPGDEIRVSKTPDPISIGDAYWSESKNVILSAERTKNIFSGDGQWVVSANMNASTRATSSAYYKYGTGVYSISTKTAFTTGKAAYYTLPSSLNLSEYQEISMFGRPSTALAANSIRICLCSDSTGDTIVDEFYLPVTTGYQLRPYLATKIGGGNLGGNINSIAIYFDTDHPSFTIYLSNIIATKTNDINHYVLISKCGTARGGKELGEGFYPIAYIDGTTVAIDSHPSASNSARKFNNFYSETVESFIRIPFYVDLSAASSTINEGGTKDNYISFKGGFEIGTTNQNGQTFYSGICGVGWGLSCSQSYVKIDSFSFSRFARGAYFSGYGLEIDIHNCVGNTEYGVYALRLISSKFSAYNMSNNQMDGVYFTDSHNNISEYISGFHAVASSNGALYLDKSHGNLFKEVHAVNGNCNVSFYHSFNNVAKIDTVINDIHLGWNIVVYASVVTIFDSNLKGGSFIFTTGGGGPYTTQVFALNILNSYLDGVFYSRRIYKNEISITFDWGDDDYSPRTGDSHYWYITQSFLYHSLNPNKFKLAEFPFNANKEVTITAWVKVFDDTTVAAAKLLVESLGYSIHIESDANTIYGNTQEGWAQLTLTFTPEISAVAELFLMTYSVGTSAIQRRFAVGSISITQAS